MKKKILIAIPTNIPQEKLDEFTKKMEAIFGVGVVVVIAIEGVQLAVV